jgi:hypothetical protein
MSVTIHNLEVRLEVDGEGDEAVFGRMFEKYMHRWQRAAEEAKRRQRMADDCRSLGDRSSSDGAP